MQGAGGVAAAGAGGAGIAGGAPQLGVSTIFALKYFSQK